jgi:hypothetical protein
MNPHLGCGSEKKPKKVIWKVTRVRRPTARMGQEFEQYGLSGDGGVIIYGAALQSFARAGIIGCDKRIVRHGEK